MYCMLRLRLMLYEVGLYRTRSADIVTEDNIVSLL